MNHIATLVFICGIAGLFFLDRERGVRTSMALWLPFAWLLIAASRPVSVWLNMAPESSPDAYLEGSPIDRNIYLLILCCGAIVLLRRRRAVIRLLRQNAPLLIFIAYCGISIGWSDFPAVAFKRWIKSLGDVVMVLIVLTEVNRTAAIRRVLTRVAFVFVPLSVLFIKYYPDLGRAYGRWEGTAFYVGMAADKNMLGKACLAFGLACSWAFIQELAGDRRRKVLAVHGVVLAMVFWLFSMATSVTSMVCFFLASSLMALITFMRFARRRTMIHIMVATMIGVCASVLFLNVGGDMLYAMGRNPTLTGRTELWQRLVTMPVNSFLGTGFESFWLGDRLERLWAIYWWHPNESHNGYLELFLNLGWVGIALLLVLILTGYRNVLKHLLFEPEAGRLRLAYFVVGLAYNFTEAAIRTMDPVWIVFVLSVIALPQLQSKEAAEHGRELPHSRHRSREEHLAGVSG